MTNQHHITIKQADYTLESDANNIQKLMLAYSQDPMGGNKALSEDILQQLPTAMAATNIMFSVLCFSNDVAVGLINCVEGFSTFKCRPLVNIHDVVVLNEYRGNGISQLMLGEVEKIARDKGCCKLTLEVLQGNTSAQKSYQKHGFDGYQLDPAMGNAMFWHKAI
jgi:ribosomal protein S18 acetylase RimI-like enzyme